MMLFPSPFKITQKLMVVRKKSPALESPKTSPGKSETLESASELTGFSKKKREQVLRAAIEVFLENGYERASMNMVAERAGVIKQTIYSHFGDKEGLFVSAVSAVTIGQVEENFRPEAVKDVPPAVVIRMVAETFISRHRDPIFIKLQRTIMSESERFPEIAELFTKATIKPGLALLTNFLSDHPEIYCPDPEAFARLLIGTFVHYSIQQNILHGRTLLPFEAERLTDEVVRVFELACLRRAVDGVK